MGVAHPENVVQIKIEPITKPLLLVLLSDFACVMRRVSHPFGVAHPVNDVQKKIEPNTKSLLFVLLCGLSEINFSLKEAKVSCATNFGGV